jgi:hypothetical protein
MEDDSKPVSVSRRIEAPAHVIFKLLADPNRHPDFDGSEMLRAGASSEVIAGVGDVFVTKMYFTAMGDYEMHNRVVAFETTDASLGSLKIQTFLGTGRAGGSTSPRMAQASHW